MDTKELEIKPVVTWCPEIGLWYWQLLVGGAPYSNGYTVYKLQAKRMLRKARKHWIKVRISRKGRA